MNKKEYLKKQEEELRKQLEAIEKEKQELLVREGKAFHCKKCNTVVRITSYAADESNKELCWGCLEKEKVAVAKERLLSALKGATIEDIIAGDRSWDIECDEIQGIIVKLKDKYYTLIAKSDYDGESFIEVSEGLET